MGHNSTYPEKQRTLQLLSRKLSMHIRDSVRMLFNYKLLADVQLNFEKEGSAEILTQWLGMFSRG